MKQSSKRVHLRQSQLITTFGPGAMVDLPTRSVIIGGLDLWHMREKGSWHTIQEPRAVSILESVLQENGRLREGVRLSLRSPPVDWGRQPFGEPPGIEAKIFPAWFVTREAADLGGGIRRRRLVRWRDLNPRGGRADFTGEDGKKTPVNPIRFVAGCKKGHIQDIDWTFAVHGAGEKCTEALWLEERGTSGDPRSTRIVCGCGRSLSLHDAQAPGRFGKCRGHRPWLHDQQPEGCTEDLRFLTRTATNTYFPQVLTVISLPAAEDELTRLIEAHLGVLSKAVDAAGIGMAREFNEAVRAALDGYSNEEVFDRVKQLQKAQQQNLEKAPKVAEFELLASGDREIGTNAPDSKLYAVTLDRSEWGGSDPGDSPIASVVAVHRLREVACLYGFTRFEAAPTAIDGDLEELYLAVEGAALASELEWLPAIEQLGEGIFLRFDEAAIKKWLSRDEVRRRVSELHGGYLKWQANL
ncbi:DrmB family protein [Rhizorhabdus wittichii]|uniref:DrmB family protein n=1 Tax=Rhizorhabdus wittichii TaxID=160791 RepID=UPI0012FDD1D6|nr:DrmB family protein [Rhizorhabdus wittichii]